MRLPSKTDIARGYDQISGQLGDERAFDAGWEAGFKWGKALGEKESGKMNEQPKKPETEVEIRERAAKIVLESDRYGLPPGRLVEKIKAVADFIVSGKMP